MLAADHDKTVLKLEDNAAEDVELPVGALGAVVMDADDTTILAFEHVQQIYPEGPAGVSTVAAELVADRVAALCGCRQSG